VLGDWDEKRLLQVAAAVEINSEHVIAKAIVKKAHEEGLESKVATQFTAIPGKGAKAMVDNEEVYLGNANLVRDSHLGMTEEPEKLLALSSQGKTVVYFLTKDRLLGLIALANLIRDESREAIKSLKDSGLEVAMITGDNKQTAAYVAKELGLDTFFAEVLPDQKANTVKSVQDKGKNVTKVGDGINDAPALVQADLGIALT
jgi:P-type E1-E2 ATPase